jgi:AcrR family transcriptional regulator
MGVDQAQPSRARRRRVAALPAEDRRQALIAATIPLLREHGITVTTRQIAEAAGVAEGTIFGVFKDKETLLRAAAVAALDPAPLLAALRAIDPEADLRQRLVEAAGLIRAHAAASGAIFHVFRGPLFANEHRSLGEIMASRCLIIGELAALMEPDAARLRRSPGIAARLLLSLVGAPRNGFGPLDEELSDEDVVSIVLDGMLVPPSDSPPAPSAPAAARSSARRARPAATGPARSSYPHKES